MKQTTDFLKMKENKEKIVMLTAYDFPSAKQAEQGGRLNSSRRFSWNGRTRIRFYRACDDRRYDSSHKSSKTRSKEYIYCS